MSQKWVLSSDLRLWGGVFGVGGVFAGRMLAYGMVTVD